MREGVDVPRRVGWWAARSRWRCGQVAWVVLDTSWHKRTDRHRSGTALCTSTTFRHSKIPLNPFFFLFKLPIDKKLWSKIRPIITCCFFKTCFHISLIKKKKTLYFRDLRNLNSEGEKKKKCVNFFSINFFESQIDLCQLFIETKLVSATWASTGFSLRSFSRGLDRGYWVNMFCFFFSILNLLNLEFVVQFNWNALVFFN